MAGKPRVFLTFLNGRKKIEKTIIFPDMGKFCEIWILMSPVKFYWNTATLIHWHTICGCLNATVAKLHCCAGLDGPQSLKYLLAGPSRKKYADPRGSPIKPTPENSRPN